MADNLTMPDNGNRLRVMFSGARVQGRGRATKWHGDLRLSGARIKEIRPVAFIHNRDTVVEEGENRVAWKVHTAGDRRGLVIEFDRPEGDLVLNTGPAQLTAPLSELMSKDRLVEAGGLAQRLEVARPPAADGPWETRFDLEDKTAGPGTHAYWVRVTQVDQEKAWSSPIWVTRR